jgi:hypothetical protein
LMCLVSVRCIRVELVFGFTILCRSNIVLCMHLVFKVTALMGGCRYVSLVCSPCCGFMCCFDCVLSVFFF